MKYLYQCIIDGRLMQFSADTLVNNYFDCWLVGTVRTKQAA